MAKITVISFKESGKMYSHQKTQLKPEHLGYRLMELIKARDPSVKEYSSDGWCKDFVHAVDVDYEDGEEGFCTFLYQPNKT